MKRLWVNSSSAHILEFFYAYKKRWVKPIYSTPLLNILNVNDNNISSITTICDFIQYSYCKEL